METLSVNVKSIARRERKNGNAELAAILDGLAIAIGKLQDERERLRAEIEHLKQEAYGPKCKGPR